MANIAKHTLGKRYGIRQNHRKPEIVTRWNFAYFYTKQKVINEYGKS